MSGPLINRSLTTVRTELEFLKDSEVLSEELYNKLLGALPPKYTNNMTPWGVDKLGLSSSSAPVEEDLSAKFASTNLNEPAADQKYCEALYDFTPVEQDDVRLARGDKLVITECLSSSWYKGYRKGEKRESAGVFPSNYVKIISESEFETPERETAPPPPKYEAAESAVVHSPPSQPPQNYGPAQNYQQQYPPQNYQNYGNAPFPPQSTNYYPPAQPPQNQEVVEQQSGSLGSNHFKKFGSKLGNAAIFGAGASIGSNIVNSIFD